MIIPQVKPLKFVQDSISAALSSVVSKPQLENFILLISSLLLGQKFNLSFIQRLLLNRKSDNAFSWFLSHSKLDLQKIWMALLAYAIQEFNLKDCLGRFIIDDTLQKHCKFCQFIEGVSSLFDHTTGTYVKGKCFVFLYFAFNEKIRFPIGWKVYVPNGKTKYILALELINEALSNGFNCSIVLVDSWYAIAPFLDALDEKKLLYVAELKSNNKIWLSCEGRAFKFGLKQFFTYCDFATKKTVLGLKTEGKSDPVRVKYTTLSANCQLCALDHRTVVVQSEMEGAKEKKYLVTNGVRLEAQAILEKYSWRWLIEEFFGDEKKLLDFEGARVRNYQAGAITVLTLSCADLLLSLEIFRISQKDSQSRSLTVSSMIKKIQEDNVQELLNILADKDKGEKFVIKWLEVLKREGSKFRRQRKVLQELYQENSSAISSSA